MAGGRGRRALAIALLVVASTISFLCITLVFAAWSNDRSIGARTGFANAEVVSVAFDRTVIRFETPDEMVHIPQNGVLYPGGLAKGQVVRVEYDRQDPDTVRVAGRNMSMTLLPLGSTLFVTWVVVGPALWWLRRSGPLFRKPPQR
ncbi:MAG: hypothetical protein GEU98_06900 [Pseudonocardiaceae bacterium]|nr:hypothetical protein [Pseudonocardiaceae bacterium]